MKLSDYIIDFLVNEGVSHIFELIGGAITHLVDSAHNRSDIKCVSVHHEQSAAFAAEAYARTKGGLGVAMATSGPGALNLVTGIGSCYFDSVPCLFITGQVNTYEYKFGRAVRQLGFQETDIVSVARPLTKYAGLVDSAEKIRYHLEKAVHTARSGRPGPVLLDIPMDIQRAEINPEELTGFAKSDRVKTTCKLTVLDGVIDLMEQARRPVLLAGGGIRTAGATDALLALVEKTGMPVVASLMGLDAIPHDHPSFFGMIGAYGNRYSNLALANCDFLLILGSRLDTRQTGTRPDTFARAARKVHVDIDPLELNEKVKVDMAINWDLGEFLPGINARLGKKARPDWSPWYATLQGYREKYPSPAGPGPVKEMDASLFMGLLSSCCAGGEIICLDVGQHQMWAGQSFRLKRGQRMLISGGMGAMGFALPAALGAARAAPGKNIIVIAGDGGMQVNIQELDTIASLKLPVKIFVLNNRCLGMVRQFQDMYFGGRRQSTVIGYSCPDFGKLAAAHGIPYQALATPDGARDIVAAALKRKGPAFVEVKLAQGTCVNPKLVVNRPIEDMSPHLDRAELKKIMLIDLAGEMEVPG
jgi:acetolactate synthase-1/2/3 large subunit